jgi:predicted HicB family RNase H-like nuclease
MSVGLLEPEVGKAKKGDTTVRIDADTAEAIRKAATLKGLSIGEYIRIAFLPIVKRDLVTEGKKLARGDKPE